MKAAVVRRFGEPLSIEDVPIPVPGRREVLVKIRHSGVCHTDLHAARGDWPVKPVLPFVPGHEGVGEIVACGADVTHLCEGDLVGIAWLHAACGHCDACLTGRETLCAEQQRTGYSVNGCFAEYALADAAYVAPIPPGLDLAAAAPVLCAGVTTYKALKQSEVRPGQWVVISGVGGLGHLAIQYAHAMGMLVAAVDIAPDKLALARESGASVTVDASREDVVAAMQREIGGAHGVVVTAVSRQAFASAIRLLRPGGTCVLVGLPPGDFPTPIFETVLNAWTIRGSIVGTRFDLREALAFAAAGAVKPHVEPARIESINAIFERLEHGSVEGRVVLDLAAPRGAGVEPAVALADRRG